MVTPLFAESSLLPHTSTAVTLLDGMFRGDAQLSQSDVVVPSYCFALFVVTINLQALAKVQNSTIETEKCYGLNWFREFALDVAHFISLDQHLDGALITDADEARLEFAVKETNFRLVLVYEDHGLRLKHADY